MAPAPNYWFVRNNDTGKVVAYYGNDPLGAHVLSSLGLSGSITPGEVTQFNGGTNYQRGLTLANNSLNLGLGRNQLNSARTFRAGSGNTMTVVRPYITPLGGLKPLGVLGAGVGAGAGIAGLSGLIGGAESGAEAAGGAAAGSAGVGGEAAGAGAATAGAGGAGTLATGGKMFGRIASSINSPLDALMLAAWMFHPRNILRAVEFLVGVLLVGFGIWTAMQARGEHLEGFSTSEGVLSRSGLGRVSRALAGGPTREAPHVTQRRAKYMGRQSAARPRRNP